MNETAKKLIFMSRGKQRYGTAGTTTTTSLASQGGLLINIDSATGDVPVTADGFIEDAKYGFYLREQATSVSAEFDTAVTRTGAKTLKISTLDNTGVARVLPAAQPNYSTVATNLANSGRYIPVKPSTKYRFSCYVKTNNLTANIDLDQVSATGSIPAVTSAGSVSGTSDWTRIVNVFTTNVATVYIGFLFYNSAGATGDAWFDINSMTLEEVVEPVANSLVTPSPSLVSFTAVGSADNIDQSSLTTGASNGVGFGGAERYWAQAFTPTKSKITGFTFIKVANVGSPTSDVVFNVYTNNAGNPSTTSVATDYTITSAQWNAIADGAEFTVNLPCTVTPGTQYWARYYATGTLDGVNYRLITRSTSGTLCKNSSDGITWNSPSARTLYFKELYYKPTTNFKASQNNQSVSISADEDGFLNGSVVNLVTGIATFTETFGTFYLLQYTISGSDLIAEINLPGVGLSASFTSDRTLEYSSDGVTYGSTFPTGFSKVWVKILAYSGFASFSYSIQFSNSGINVLKNYPTNKDIIKQYSTTLGGATTSATYRATKWGFPAIEYSSTEYQYLDVDTTATGSTVAFSELGTTYTTVADGASLAISSTSTPNLFVKANITANRLYLSSNDTNASSDKDGSLRQTLTYNVIQ